VVFFAGEKQYYRLLTEKMRHRGDLVEYCNREGARPHFPDDANGRTGKSMTAAYDPTAFRGLTFHDRLAAFEAGEDDPRAYLERCYAVVEAREPVVKAFEAMNREAARSAADASAARWKAGRPLSQIDGMPVGIKDLLETKDMPTEMGAAGLKGNFPKRDNAAVMALREAGAVIFGKTVTAELGGAHPVKTTNPFDPARTPGGSSSGSAAAVGAGMVPAAIGTQIAGSIIRPAAWSGNVGIKPTQGGIHRGERQTTSMSTHGVHANAFEDMWRVAMEIVSRVGGDPGQLGVQGPMTAPGPLKPDRLIVLETAGWSILDDASKAAFETLLERIANSGVTLLRRGDSAEVEALEQAIADASETVFGIIGWENRVTLRNLLDSLGSDGISQRAQAGIAKAEAMTVSDYRACLGARAAAQLLHNRVGGMADGVIGLSCPGPAPAWVWDEPGKPLAPRPTGDTIFNVPSSMLFAPVVTAPMMAVGGMPVGAQMMGRPGEDARMAGLARWMQETIPPVVA